MDQIAGGRTPRKDHREDWFTFRSEFFLKRDALQAALMPERSALGRRWSRKVDSLLRVGWELFLAFAGPALGNATRTNERFRLRDQFKAIYRSLGRT